MILWKNSQIDDLHIEEDNILPGFALVVPMQLFIVVPVGHGVTNPAIDGVCPNEDRADTRVTNPGGHRGPPLRQSGRHGVINPATDGVCPYKSRADADPSFGG